MAYGLIDIDKYTKNMSDIANVLRSKLEITGKICVDEFASMIEQLFKPSTNAGNSNSGSSSGNNSQPTTPTPSEPDIAADLLVLGSSVAEINGAYSRFGNINGAPAYKHVSNTFYIYKWTEDDVWIIGSTTECSDPGDNRCYHYTWGSASVDLTTLTWQGNTAAAGCVVRPYVNLSNAQKLIVDSGTKDPCDGTYVLAEGTGDSRVWYGNGYSILRSSNGSWIIHPLYETTSTESGEFYTNTGATNPYSTSGETVQWFYRGDSSDMTCTVE